MAQFIGRVHDANLLGISATPDGKSVTLSARRSDGSSCQVIFNGVVCFRCDAFLQGNIILSLTEVSPPDLSAWLKEAFGDYAPAFDQVRQEVEAQRLSCFSLTSSYGAEASCLARQIEIMEQQA